MNSALGIHTATSVGEIFAFQGREVRAHKGRSVVTLTVDGKRHYLKRFWWTPSKPFKRHVARGFHELRMIDWLNQNGFAGPKVVNRGSSGLLFFRLRMFFLMEELPGERSFEATWRKHPDESATLLEELGSFAARLHDSGFVHTDFSQRHIFVGRAGSNWTFRLIDLERAYVGRIDDGRAAADLATLAASVTDPQLRERIETDFLDGYIARRTGLASQVDFRALFARAKPTRQFL